MSGTVCSLLFNSRADTVHFCLLYWSWVLSTDHNCCLLASITSLSAKINVSPYFCHFTRDGWMCNHKTRAWCKQSILILILAQTNCTAECLHTVVLRTSTTKQKCLFPYTLRPPKCGFHFSLPITPKYFGTAVSLIISWILFWQHMTQIHGLVNFAWRALKNLLCSFPSSFKHRQVYRIRFPWPWEPKEICASFPLAFWT